MSKNKTQNNIIKLRNHLFTTMERLLDKNDPMDAAQAKSIANVGRVMVDSAKVEIEFMKAFGVGNGTRFILPPPQAEDQELLN